MDGLLCFGLDVLVWFGLESLVWFGREGFLEARDCWVLGHGELQSQGLGRKMIKDGFTMHEENKAPKICGQMKQCRNGEQSKDVG